MKYLFFVLFLSFGFSLQAQEDDRYTEDEIAIQDKFVEAKKFSLIGRYEKAEKILKQIYKEDRKNAVVALELSKVYRALEDPYNEYRFAEAAMENANANEYMLINFASICMDQEKYAEALPSLTNLVALDPTSEEYTDKLATAHLNLNDDASAIKAYNAIESKIGITENVSRRKFEIYQIKNESKKAVIELKALSDAFPYDISYKHNLAAFYNKIGKEKDALKVYKSILELDINDATANMAIATSDSGEKIDNNYLRSLGPIIENKSIPVDRKVLEMVPYVDQVMQKYDPDLMDALITLSDKIALNHPKEAKAYALKGDVFMAANRYDDAVKAYEKTISLKDNIYAVWEGLMYALEMTENYTKLKQISTQALDLYPNKASAYRYYGRGYAKSGSVDEAIDILEEGVMVSGKNIQLKSDIYAELGRAYADKGEFDKAEEKANKALDLSQGRSGFALEAMGDILAKKGDKKAAITYWEKAKKAGLVSEILDRKIEG